MEAMETMAKKKPIPDPKPNTVDSNKVYSLSTRKMDPPRIEQFTAINGRKMPRL